MAIGAIVVRSPGVVPYVMPEVMMPVKMSPGGSMGPRRSGGGGHDDCRRTQRQCREMQRPAKRIELNHTRSS
jgi:hypothetical protein